MRKNLPKILVTGATGFVGSNLTRKLIALSCPVTIFVRKSSNFWRIKDMISKLDIYEVDISDAPKVKKNLNKIRPDVIFHLANAGLYRGESASPEILVKTNLIGTINLMEAAKNIPTKLFVNTGSSAEYGPKNKPMNEEDLCMPTTFYGLTKLSSTLATNIYASRQKIPIVTLRLFSPFGPFDDKSRLISHTILSALKNKPLYLGSPTSVRDYIFIGDVISAYLKFLISPKRLVPIINIGSGSQLTVQTVVAKILKFTNSKSKIYWHRESARPQESPVWQADIQKAKKLLKWQPKTKIDEGFIKTIEWFRKNLRYYT